MKQVERKIYIDIAKGIGIILVILGHLNTVGQISRNFIYSFHMPMFFLLSGMLVNVDIKFGEYIKKYFYTLFIPYIIFAIIDSVITIALKYFHGLNMWTVLAEQVNSIIGINFQLNNLPIWFLYVLFFIHISYYFIGSYAMLVLSILLMNTKYISKFLAYCGRNSIILLVGHYYICRIILSKVMTWLKLSQYLYSQVTQVIVLSAVLLIFIPVIKFVNRHLGFVFGKKNG